MNKPIKKLVKLFPGKIVLRTNSKKPLKKLTGLFK
jgi:hypothetical protein